MHQASILNKTRLLDRCQKALAAVTLWAVHGKFQDRRAGT